jgi:hypothetical protein
MPLGTEDALHPRLDLFDGRTTRFAANVQHLG